MSPKGVLCTCVLVAVSCKFSEGTIVQADDDFCEGITGAGAKTVLMSADPGDYIGVGEAIHMLANLQSAQNKSSGYCQSVVEGTLLDQPVLVVASGINGYNQQACMNELLQCSRNIREVIAFGTSGWSPAVGGIIDPADCSQTGSGDITRIGDICVTPFASNWACKLASWEKQCAGYPNVCSYPGAEYELTQNLFGQCTFAAASDAAIDLTMEVRKGAIAAQYVGRSDGLRNYSETYWTQMQSQGSNTQYDADPGQAPTIWHHDTCGISSSQFFWSGVPWDAVARNYTAQLINEALNTTATQQSVIAVSDEEGNGLLQALQRFNYLLGPEESKLKMSYTIVRTNSNYVHVPVAKTDDIWTDASPFLAPDLQLGFPYAIATASTAILHTLQSRCVNNGGSKDACVFTITY